MQITAHIFLLICLGFLAGSAIAEPYLAVRTGMKCMVCHTNPTGGGKRTDFGRIYGQKEMPARTLGEPFTQNISKYLDLGGDLRTSFNHTRIPHQENQSAFKTERASLYIEGKIIPQRLSFYIDQQLSPATNSREAFMLFWNESRDMYLKAGRIFLPYGLRLEDDTAFIRQVTGVNFASSDDGIEGGYEKGPWSINLAISNGANGGAEIDNGKQASLRAAYIHPEWRLGGSINLNDLPGREEQQMQNLFGTLKWLGMEWLVEIDRVVDLDIDGEEHEQLATLFEINRELIKGHNVKFTMEFLDPDTNIDENQRNRASLLWEYTPVQMLSLRVGARTAEGIPQNDRQNADLFFVQLHAWF